MLIASVVVDQCPSASAGGTRSARMAMPLPSKELFDAPSIQTDRSGVSVAAARWTGSNSIQVRDAR